ncbi:MAG: DUF2333 family protein [Pseudomonadota bacterium]
MWEHLKGLISALWDHFTSMMGPILRGMTSRMWALVVSIFVGLVILYYLVGMAVVHVIDDDPTFTPGTRDLVENGSQTVAIISGLMDREVNRNGWVANDPFFYASSALDNMPNFQQGMRAALNQVVLELRDQIGRNRGSSAADPDLEEAVGDFNYQGTIWHFKFPNIFIPQPTSEELYRRGIKALRAYNKRVASGDAVFETRVDNLLATVDRIALDLGSSAAGVDQYVRTHAGGLGPDFGADDLFYNVKGRAYAILMVMRGLKADFPRVIEARELESVWQNLDDSLAKIVRIDPFIVMNSRVDGLVFPNHLAVQGFYLMRARGQMRELTGILEK